MSTLTSILSTDLLSASRSTLNDNYQAINVGKAESSVLTGSYAFINSQIFTGTPTLPTGTIATTQSASDNSTKIATTAYVDAQHLGYVIEAVGTSLAPADGLTYYFGSQSTGPTNTADVSRLYIPKAGKVKAIYLFFRNAGTLSTSETSTLNFRLNNTTSTLISSAVTFTAASNAFSNTALSISVVAGDYFEIEWVCPTWVTNPTATISSAIVYIE